tara:strand:- start:5046 stop:6107 length:1062 start_codon:yes stop_codon:yes gene_type:complete
MIHHDIDIDNYISEKFMNKKMDATISYDIEIPEKEENMEIKDETMRDNVLHQPSYKYLSNNVLDKELPINIQEKVVNYVLYNIRDDTHLPYLNFLVKGKNDILSFPNEIINDNESDIDTESDISEEDNTIPVIDNDDITITDLSEEMYLLKQNYKYLNENFNIDAELIEDIYDGYVELNNEFYMFIEVSNIDIDIPTDEYSWVIVDEIINNGHSNNIQINNNIIELFLKNLKLREIYENEEAIEYPIVVYLCGEEGDKYINVQDNNKLSITLINDKIDDEIFGLTQIFSRRSLISSSTNNKRYCLFTKDANYIFHQDFTKQEVKLITNTSCIRFTQNDIEFWSVKDIGMYSCL